jgi:hypothetical protein
METKFKTLTLDEIKKVAPSIFTAIPLSTLSDRYTHIPTSQVIEDIMDLGWEVVEVQQVNARVRKGTQKHIVIFRNPDVIIEGEDGDDVYPQILLTNSHDGKNSFKFEAGLFRMICSNGLVIKSENFEEVKIRHLNYTFEELTEVIAKMVDELPLIVDSMNAMKEKEMSDDEILSFISNALLLRFSKKELNRIAIDPLQMLEVKRVEDEGNDLWKVFNVVQERLLGGEFTYDYAGKTRKARKIKNFQQLQQLNKDLFDLALSFVDKKEMEELIEEQSQNL